MIFDVGKMYLSNNIVDDSNLLFVFWANYPIFIVRQCRLNKWAVARGPTITGAHANL